MEKPDVKIKIGSVELTPGEAEMVQRALNWYWPERIPQDLKTPDILPNFEIEKE